ncbi:MAG: serine hydrolase [Acidobacteria bacterium]|nr:serine hydrolase [Acidobacteriota bacterium]
MKHLLAWLVLAAVPASGQLEWKTLSPEAAGLDRAKLDAWSASLRARKTSGLLVIRRGAIVHEWYDTGWGPDRVHGTASMAKALVGGMSLLVVMHDGLIGADDLASKYIPAWKNDPRKSKITIRHLATHTSGIEDAEQDQIAHEKLPGWKGAFWRRDPDPFSIAVRDAPAVFEPGTQFAYSNPGMAALAYAVTASLRGSRWGDIRALLRERVMLPIGVPDKAWSIGYGRAYEVDGLKLYANWGGGSYTARAAARVAELLLHGGEWKGTVVLKRDAVHRALADAGMPKPDRAKFGAWPGSGLAFYTNADGVWEGVPRDAFAGAGAGHQVFVAIPSLDLIVVRNGEALVPRSEKFWPPIYQELVRPLIAAVTERSPYPRSAVIRGVRFAPVEQIRREAIDSDNWPLTWADDDAMYTSYGDGFGFAPRMERKLSMGFARISGTADSFVGTNVRSTSGETVGDGRRGPKASGILMVDGVLYMWVRNLSNAQLWWSKDRGVTWQKGFKLETSFGSPSFLNYGKNYAGARDSFVYTYSQDGPSAYESDNALVLARVPKHRIADRAAWEFFERLDAGGRPQWSGDVARRGAAFVKPVGCQRVDAVYNPGIGRYLLAVSYGHNGGWGIFDAPEPWGPWTTAFHTEDWGLGGTHGYRLPSKWISSDGRTMSLVFSGVRLPSITYDAFCVRRMDLELR